MQRPYASFASAPANAAPPPSLPLFSAHRSAQTERLHSASQHRPTAFTAAAVPSLRPNSSSGSARGLFQSASATASADRSVPLSGPWARRSADPPLRMAHTHYSNGCTFGVDGATTTSAPTAATTTLLPTLSPHSPRCTRSTASAPSSGVLRGTSQPTSFTTPLRPTPPPTVQPDLWMRRSGGMEPSSAPSPLSHRAVFIPQQTQSTHQPESCSAAQLVLSDVSVRELRLPHEAAAAAVTAGPVLLRGALGGGGASSFTTAAVWPVPEARHQQQWEDISESNDALPLLSASWPALTVAEVVDMPLTSSSGAGEVVSSFVCECYMQHPSTASATAPSHSLLYVGCTEVALTELAEAATAAADEQRGHPVKVVLRDDAGAVVGHLNFTVAVVPLSRRTVRLRGVVVQPDPLLASDDYDDNRRRGTSTAALQDGDLAISLVAPQQLSRDAAAAGACPYAVPAVADLRTPAMARWTTLPAFSFTGTASRSSESEAGGVAPLPPLLVGELLYYPTSTTRLDSRSPILLGTFSVPPPASHSASAASASYTFHVPLRTSPAGARWMAMGDCWVRGGVETWEEASAKACSAAPVRAANTDTISAFKPYAPLSSPERQQQRVERVNHGGAIVPASAAVTPLAQQQLVPPPTPPEDVAMQRVRERQEALLHRVEFRLDEVRQQRANIQAEMAAQDAAAAAEGSAIVEEYGLLEAQKLEVEAAYREATAQLAELQQLHADQTAEQEAYLAEQTQALEEVAQERAEAVELRAQLEALQVQMKAHMAAEQQRYDARVERTRAAIGRVEANARWLTEVEAK